MAAEMSLRADEDRRRKLQLQEEADLAYAIALSKAEAASLKQTWTFVIVFRDCQLSIYLKFLSNKTVFNIN